MHHTDDLIMLWYPWPRQKAHGSWGIDIFVDILSIFVILPSMECPRSGFNQNSIVFIE